MNFSEVFLICIYACEAIPYRMTMLIS